MPKYTLILDVNPECFIKKGDYSTKTIIFDESLDYLLDKNTFSFLKDFNNLYYLKSKSKLLKNSEPYQYEKITKGKSILTLCPLFNYHHGTYFVEKIAIKNFINSVNLLINKMLLLD